MPAGRPPKYKSPEEMQRIIDLYFIACKVHQTGDDKIMEGMSEDDLIVINDIDDTIPTITGLALALDLTRDNLLNYQGKPEFQDTVKRAKEKVHAFVEQRLLSGGQAAGPIFNLKNNFGWKDKTEQEITGNIDINQLTDEQLNAKIAALMGK
jgi:hypothetical protein